MKHHEEDSTFEELNTRIFFLPLSLTQMYMDNFYL